MAIKTISQYAFGTSVETAGPWNIPVGCMAFCPDGKVRKLKRVSINPKSTNKINGAINFNGKTVSAYVTVMNLEGMSEEEKYTQMIHFMPSGTNASFFERKELKSDEK